MCIVTHIHHRHLADFVDNLSIVAIVEDRRNCEDRIHHHHEAFFATHQINQALRVVEDRPSIVPAVSFRKGITPLQRRERSHELTVLQFATHQFRF